MTQRKATPWVYVTGGCACRKTQHMLQLGFPKLALPPSRTLASTVVQPSGCINGCLHQDLAESIAWWNRSAPNNLGNIPTLNSTVMSVLVTLIIRILVCVQMRPWLPCTNIQELNRMTWHESDQQHQLQLDWTFMSTCLIWAKPMESHHQITATHFCCVLHIRNYTIQNHNLSCVPGSVRAQPSKIMNQLNQPQVVIISPLATPDWVTTDI